MSTTQGEAAAIIEGQHIGKKGKLAITMELESYESCGDWLESLNSEYTRMKYTFVISRFVAFINIGRDPKLTPDQIIKLDNETLKNLTSKYVLHMKRHAKNTVGKAKKGELSVNTLKNYTTGIKSWFDYNEVNTSWWKRKVKKTLPRSVRNKLRGYSPEEIAKMIDLGDPFDRAQIVLFKGGGERVGGQEGLTFNDIERLPEYDMGILHVYRNSAEDYYTVPLSKEDLFYIDAMKAYRVEHHENVTDNSPLIRDKFMPYSPRTNKPRQITRDAVRKRMRRLAKMAGVPLEEIAPNHSFRYFFDTALMNSDCKWEIKELMMGHKVRLDKFYYDEKNPESRKKLVTEYMKAVDSLTVMPQFKMTKKIAELEQKAKKADEVEGVKDMVIAVRLESDAWKKKWEESEKMRQRERDEDRKEREQEMKRIKTTVNALVEAQQTKSKQEGKTGENESA